MKKTYTVRNKDSCPHSSQKESKVKKKNKWKKTNAFCPHFSVFRPLIKLTVRCKFGDPQQIMTTLKITLKYSKDRAD